MLNPLALISQSPPGKKRKESNMQRGQGSGSGSGLQNTATRDMVGDSSTVNNTPGFFSCEGVKALRQIWNKSKRESQG